MWKLLVQAVMGPAQRLWVVGRKKEMARVRSTKLRKMKLGVLVLAMTVLAIGMMTTISHLDSQ